MKKEIFGPLVPILEFSSIDEVLGSLAGKTKPLALYFFSSDKARQRRVLETASLGGGCVNDTILHVAKSRMPFGGVEESGMGSYHGKASFETFSHAKSALVKSYRSDLQARCPPFGTNLP